MDVVFGGFGFGGGPQKDVFWISPPKPHPPKTTWRWFCPYSVVRSPPDG